jgi:dihydrofolate reductase
VRKLSVVEFLSLDGVMQAPGGPDEDTEGGFQNGGWAMQFMDQTGLESATTGMAETDAYLFGRKTYEIMASFWPTAPADDPFGKHLNQTRKYVASRTLKSPKWKNSSVMQGEVVEEVAKLKGLAGKNITVLGSGDLVQTLMANDLVDQYVLTMYPIVLGGGKRLFRDDKQLRTLKLVDSTPTSTGGLILVYEPAT